MPSASPIPSTPLGGALSASEPAHKYTATAYCGNFGPHSINGTGVTAGGTDLRDGKQHYVIAAGPGSGLKIGDTVRISPSPFGDGTVFKVDDHGGAIIGRHIDIYVADCAKATAWGRRGVNVSKVSGQQTPGPADGSVQSQIGNLSPFQMIDKLVSLLGVLFTSEFWRRIGLIGLGVIALVIGLVFIGREYLPTPDPAALAPLLKGLPV